MSSVVNEDSLEIIELKFDKLLNYISDILKEVRPRTNILNTRLGKIKKKLSNIGNLDVQSISEITMMVSKYNSIIELFEGNIKYEKNNLIKLIEGGDNYSQDSNEKYNDCLFELSMGVRFAKAFKGYAAKINMDGDCDVIIEDTIAIECKYIHSTSGILNNVRKAKKQIEKRVSDGQAKFGLIAIDLSNVVSKDKINEFIKFTFDRYIENYKLLSDKGVLKGDVVENVMTDRNLPKIIQTYISSEVETVFYSNVGFDYDFGNDVRGILFQAMNSYPFECNSIIKPVVMRGMNYFIDKKLNDDEYSFVKKLIHQLAVGF